MNPSASIAICPTHNARGKHDVTGAFLPEAEAFTRFRAAEGNVLANLRQFDNRAAKWRRRREVEAILDGAPYPLSVVAFFCHGRKRGIQTGHQFGALGSSVQRLAKAIARNSVPKVRVVLYACHTGRDADSEQRDDMKPGPGGEGGFADKLRDALVAEGCSGGVVDAHTVRGHTTTAPWVRRFYITEAAAPMGGDWLVSPGSEKWRTWRKRLQSDACFRLSFPLMTTEAVRGALG